MEIQVHTFNNPEAGTTYTPGTGVWNIGSLLNGITATLTITATVDSTSAGTITNTALLTALDQGDIDAANNIDSATISVVGDLYLAGQNNDRVFLYDGSGTPFLGEFVIPDGSDGVANIKWGPDGNLYVTSFFSNEVNRFDGTTGAYIAPAFVASNLFRSRRYTI